MGTPNLRELSRLADCDERTIVRFYSGEPVRPRVRKRIETALAAMQRRPSRRKAA